MLKPIFASLDATTAAPVFQPAAPAATSVSPAKAESTSTKQSTPSPMVTVSVVTFPTFRFPDLRKAVLRSTF